MDLLFPKTRQVTVSQDGLDVLLKEAGRIILTMPYDSALVIAQAITEQAHKAEEKVKAEQIIYDQAILHRMGANIGLTSNPILLNAAANEAHWNTKLRRFLTGNRARGLSSRSVVGRPALKKEAVSGFK